MVGVRPFPSSAMTLGVVALICAGVALIQTETSAGLPITTPTRIRKYRHAAALAVPCVLAARGLGGIVVSAFKFGTATDQFRRWDLRLYSPVCLLLAGCSAIAIGRHPGILN